MSLWPLNASPVSSRPRRQPLKVAEVQPAAETEATVALAAITSSYRRGRAGIISGDAPAGQLGEESPADLARPTHLPTVPLAFLTKPTSAELPQGPADEDRVVTTLWSRLVRTRRPAPRGRHSPKP